MPQGSIGLNALTGHIHNFERWKSDLSRSLKSFRLWLRRNDLFSETVDKRLFNLLSVLKDDYVTIAFAGEFSRGKTELINAMFFARYGQRILPSQAGRTTMCPTELFYDREKDQTYIKLLSIDTRNDPRPLTEFRELDDYWLEFPLDTDSAESMADSLRRVTETKLVSKEEAEELGFDSEHLDQEGELVEVPKWRHALVSFDHPMLQKGLCILDTPGLNALGSEPELTLSLLPSAQAVIFLLAADAGVTASDMKIWDEHISQLKNRPNLGLYAVLNKVDVLWDDLSTEQQIQANVDNVIQTTAKQLDIPEKNVIPVSAQKALLGRVKADDELFNKSRLQHLEDILSQTIMGTKEENLWHDVIVDASEIVRDSLGLLTNRHKQLIQQREEVQSVKEMSSGEVEQLAEKLQAQKQTYQSQLLNFKPSLKLVERQAQMLKDTLAPDKIQAEIDSAAEQMTNSKSSVGMLKAMRNFFIQVDKMMIDFCHEAERCNRLAESTFERYQDDDNHDPFVPRLL
ncbi:MAG: dynamin family protein, partial [Gammaproteobacteria bacterium]|nr:dynamin family protein [Gammaproteobacteria bacterium]